MAELSRFERVKQILDTAVNGENFGAHGAFWRGLTRDEFVEHKVFGQQLLVVGDCEASNLVHALKGTGLFANAPFRRMPAGREPVTPEHIDFICHWIDDGCPDKDTDAVDPQTHIDYWRDFDNWAMWNRIQPIADAIDLFMGSAAFPWMTYAKDSSQEQAWIDVIQAASMKDAVTILSSRQIQTIQEHYGNPVVWSNLFAGYEQFGDDSLPDDALRPADERHNMNGTVMWFFWSAFADACLRLDIDRASWQQVVRAILLGLMNDGLFRGRFPVADFTANEAGKVAIREHVRSLADDDLQAELVKRFVESGL